MNSDEIINQAIKELKEHDKPYKMFEEFSFMTGLKWEDDKFQKTKYLIVKSTPFEKHTNHAVKLSSTGLTIAHDHKDWYAYKKSLKPKLEYSKWVASGIAFLSLSWNIYQGISNNSLKDENNVATDKIKQLETANGRLVDEVKRLTNERPDSLQRK